MEFEEIGAKVKKTFGGKKGIFIVGGLLLGAFVISYILQSKNEEEVVRVERTYDSYPDASPDTDVLYSDISDMLDARDKEIYDFLGEMADKLAGDMKDLSEATNDYINEGFNSMKDKVDLEPPEQLPSTDDLDSITPPTTNVGGNTMDKLPAPDPLVVGTMSSSKDKWIGSPPDGAYVINGLTGETTLLTPSKYQELLNKTSYGTQYVAVNDDSKHFVEKGDALNNIWTSPAKEQASKHLSDALNKMEQASAPIPSATKGQADKTSSSPTKGKAIKEAKK